MDQDGFSEAGDGWNRWRCGAGPDCEGRFEWWEPEIDWFDVSASGDMSPRDRVLNLTAGWGDWNSKDMFANHGDSKVARRHAKIGFISMTRTDFERSLTDLGFDDISHKSDGAFNGFDQGPVEGAFFSPTHQEVAGMFNMNDVDAMRSFGAVSRD